MARNQKDISYDHALLMKDTSAAITSSAAALVGGVAKSVNFGAGRVDGRVIIDATAINVGAGEMATVHLQVTNDNFTATKSAGCLTFGDVTINGETQDSTVGRRELAFTNEIDGVIYTHGRLYTVILSTGSLTYKAFLALDA